MTFPSASVVIPNFNGAKWLPGCLGGLAAQTFRGFEVIVVDNGSVDGSVEWLAQHDPEVRLVALGRNTGFAAAVNAGIAIARGEYVALLNNDTLPRPEWLSGLVDALETSPPSIGAVASMMISMEAPERLDNAGDALSWTGAAEKKGHGQPLETFSARREILSPCAGAALYRRSFLEHVGGFDERFFAYLEDLDVGLRGRLLGYSYHFEPSAQVLHKGQGSSLPRPDYVRLVTCNRLTLFAKNVPLRLLIKHFPQLAYGQLYFLIAYRHPLHSLAGYARFLLQLPQTSKQRRRIARSRRITPGQIDSLLSLRHPEPTLRSLFRRWIRQGA
jgi:GT2 family glycosyltransferase